MSIDFKAIVGLGPKALILFLTGTTGCGTGWAYCTGRRRDSSFPEQMGGEGADATWRGMATIAGSWIGGSANQAAMKEVFQPSGEYFFSDDYGGCIGRQLSGLADFVMDGCECGKRIDMANGADTTALEQSERAKLKSIRRRTHKNPSTADLIKLLVAVGFGLAGIWLIGCQII